MAKIRLTSPTFDASAKTVTHASFSDVGLPGIQLITNVTDNVIIYNFADATKGGSLATDTLTLDFDTTSMSDTDELMILVEDGATTQPISGTVTAELGATDNAVLDAIAASVAAIDVDATTIIGHVDGIETLVTSTNTKLDTLITQTDGIEGLLTTIDADTGAILTAVDGLETSNAAIQTAVELIDNAIGVEDAAETVGGGLMMAGTVRRDTAASSAGTTGGNATLNTDSLGRLWISGAAVEDAAETAGGILLMAGSVRRDTAASSAGTTGDNATINTDSVGALWTRDTATQVDDAAFTPATGRVMPVGFLADETATDSVDEGDAGISRMTLDRKQIVTPYAHATAGGATPYYNLDVDETEDEIKGTAGKVFWLHAVNLSASKLYLKFYNATAANVTVGTTTPVLSLPIPTLATTNGQGFTINFGDMGVQFSTAITVACVTGFADNSTGAPGANECIINLSYL